jgi:aspartate/glutamate racemase
MSAVSAPVRTFTPSAVVHAKVQSPSTGISAGAFPVKASFSDAGAAAAYVAKDYTPGLTTYAKEFEVQNGRKPKDQDFPVEVISMVPRNPTAPPLLIVGGMGPLAGAQAMEAALQKFGDSREIVLLQLCDTPDRTAALNKDAEQKGVSDEHKQVVEGMKNGLLNAEGMLKTSHLGQAHVVVACNTAHNFVPEGFQAYSDVRVQNAGLKLDSMVKSVTTELARTQKGAESPVVILGTDGTLKTRLYIDPLEANDVKCAVPTPDNQQKLMDAIYKGVKAFDPDATLAHGSALFLGMAQSGQIKPGEPFVILAACTEVPEIVNTLKEKGSPEVKELMAKAQVADPMGITLGHVAQADAASTVTTFPQKSRL